MVYDRGIKVNACRAPALFVSLPLPPKMLFYVLLLKSIHNLCSFICRRDFVRFVQCRLYIVAVAWSRLDEWDTAWQLARYSSDGFFLSSFLGDCAHISSCYYFRLSHSLLLTIYLNTQQLLPRSNSRLGQCFADRSN
jgi:hypothetical protein